MNDSVVEEHRDLYAQALSALNERGVPYMLGGAFAVHHYTNLWRDTHDIDIYITPETLDQATDALRSAGFHDLGEQALGDRDWIYHAGRESVIVDVIWRFANLANYVSDDWFARAPRGRFLGIDVAFLPLEELIWIKVFIINRHRCDWPDVLRLIRARCEAVNWDRLLDLLGEHWLLLAAVVDVFDWQHADSTACIPDHIREELARRHQGYGPGQGDQGREHLLDPWLHLRADRDAIWRNE